MKRHRDLIIIFQPCYCKGLIARFLDPIGLRGGIVKTGNRDENWFLKHKEPDFLSARIGGKNRAVQPLNNLKKKQQQLNTILFYLIKLSISYKE